MIHITGTTRLVGVLGYPVRHSLSPDMHNAAFDALNMDWCYVPFEVAPERLEQAMTGLAALGVVGVNLTIPHKRGVVPLLDEVRGDARVTGSVNTVHFEGGRAIGYSTDGDGFLGALADLGVNPAGIRAVVLGAGGSAAAIVVALARAGAAAITIANRTAERAQRLAELVASQPALGTEIAVTPWCPESLGSTLEEANLLVNTTSVGMKGSEQQTLPVPAEAWRPDLAVYDIVYTPLETPLLRSARERGGRALGGARMLVLQGAISFEIWAGVKAPVETMESALLAALERVHAG
jgi:shikimate dehydrogenase